MSYLLVFLGAGIGGMARHAVNGVSSRLWGAGFPWHTLSVNIIGSAAMGLLVGWLALRADAGGAHLRLFLATGVLGGFTTFSAFSLDAWLLWERGQTAAAGTYVLGSVALSIAGLGLGLWLARLLAPG